MNIFRFSYTAATPRSRPPASLSLPYIPVPEALFFAFPHPTVCNNNNKQHRHSSVSVTSPAILADRAAIIIAAAVCAYTHAVLNAAAPDDPAATATIISDLEALVRTDNTPPLSPSCPLSPLQLLLPPSTGTSSCTPLSSNRTTATGPNEIMAVYSHRQYMKSTSG